MVNVGLVGAGMLTVVGGSLESLKVKLVANAPQRVFLLVVELPALAVHFSVGRQGKTSSLAPQSPNNLLKAPRLREAALGLIAKAALVLS